MWLIDAYRSRNNIILWIKTPEKNIRMAVKFHAEIYIEQEAEQILNSNNIEFSRKTKLDYMRRKKNVLTIPVEVSEFEKKVRDIEKITKHRIPLYNADIPPEQLYLYMKRLKPCSPVLIENNQICAVESDETIPLKKIDIEIGFSNGIVKTALVNGKEFSGDEESLLRRFTNEFISQDADVVVMGYAFSRLPLLVKRLAYHNIYCPFHRWDAKSISYKGGKSYYSYGTVRYQDFAVRLNGRFLIDKSTVIGSELDIEAIIELCSLSGARFQQIASRSFGAVFQAALVRKLVERGYLIPYKEKPIEKPLSLLQLLKSDRAGHIFDPKPGFHRNVAELDFTSMFPWIIYNHNISADTLLSGEGPFENVPGIPVSVSLRNKGLVPEAIKPFIDRRMMYKKNPTSLNKARAIGLKQVLVTSYGYLRFREFKLGLPSSHMAICAYAREIIIAAARLAEEKGFEVVHGIIDSLYIKKKNINEKEVQEFCRELEMITGIPVSFEGIFRWIVFLPSIINEDRQVPAKYFGVFRNNDLKVRGLEVRQRMPPLVVKWFQQKALEKISVCNSKKEILEKVPELFSMLKSIDIAKLQPEMLACTVRISRTDYRHNIPQKQIVQQLQKKKIKVLPGQTVHFIYKKNKVVLPEDFKGLPDIEQYRKLLIRSLFAVLQPFGIKKHKILEGISSHRQSTINDFRYQVKHVYVPIRKKFESYGGVSEKELRKRLGKQGWIVWKSALINIINDEEVYPNVRRKYEKLHGLLDDRLEMLRYICHVHHGLPDFICYRNGIFKFVECKLGHEQLSDSQKKCIPKLIDMGFDVEVHKLVHDCTKTRIADVNLKYQIKNVVEKQTAVMNF
jgi:DNA polymerase-2